jgi:intracellular sulfur oxidation DsrE/DsrF family protein
LEFEYIYQNRENLKTTLSFKALLLFQIVFFSSFGAWAQQKTAGPIVPGYGEVFLIPEATYTTDLNHDFKVVYDVMFGAEENNQLNPFFESVARFLNMHGQSGVAANQLHPVLVVHNKASKDLLSDDEYMERFGVPNPNSGLLESLMQAGVEVILCGQSSKSRDIPIEKTVPGTKLALSAMTALIQFQDAGYRLIKY